MNEQEWQRFKENHFIRIQDAITSEDIIKELCGYAASEKAFEIIEEFQAKYFKGEIINARFISEVAQKHLSTISAKKTDAF